MDEKTFFQYEGVQVTNARFVVDGQTFAMNNITSVKPLEKKPSRVWPVALVVIGLFMAFNGANAGFVVALIGGVWFAMQKTVYHVMLHTSGGESSALKTYQKDYLDKVVAALNSAIIARG